MPRLPRRKSATNIYHVMLRGINRQSIFEEKEDYYRFLETLKKYKTISKYEIFAYCLMSNHVHVLIKTENESLSSIIKRIAGSYVYWFNNKYYRDGHLFQDRFKSEVVESDEYLLTVIRYIHQNPVKAGMVDEICDYEYSSYSSYVDNMGIVDTKFIFSITSKEEFISFNNEPNTDNCLDVQDAQFRINDKDAKRLIKKISNCDSSAEFQALERNDRNKCIKKLKDEGLSIRQISRLTGVSKGIVARI